MKRFATVIAVLCILASCTRRSDEVLTCTLDGHSPYSYYMIRVPNAFTPNGDGKNDRYRIILTAPHGTQYTMKIMDRDGSALFVTDDPASPGWDGRSPAGVSMAPGRYEAQVTVRNIMGETYTNNYCIALLSYGGRSCIPRADGPYYFEDMYDSGGFNYQTAETICQ